MKRLKIKWLQWCSQVLSVVIAMLGFGSCHSAKQSSPPSVMYGSATGTFQDPPEQAKMYGPPPARFVQRKDIDASPSDSAKSDSQKVLPPIREFKAMYGAPPVRYEKIEKDGVDIKIEK